MMDSAVARELSAATHVFSSAGQALFFYVREFGRRTGIQVPLEYGSIPMPRVVREQREATYARIVAALHEREPEDYSFDPPLTEERLNALVHWYMSDQPRASLVEAFAKALELRSETWVAFCRECRRTRNMFRRRMSGRGLVAT